MRANDKLPVSSAPVEELEGIFSLFLRRREVCPDFWIGYVTIYGIGRDKEEAARDLRVHEADFVRSAEESLRCQAKVCTDGKCVFDYGNVEDRIDYSSNPAITTKRYKIRVESTVVAKRVNYYGCFCIHEV